MDESGVMCDICETWLHYMCERLDQSQISKIESESDMVYICRSCTSISEPTSHSTHAIDTTPVKAIKAAENQQAVSPNQDNALDNAQDNAQVGIPESSDSSIPEPTPDTVPAAQQPTAGNESSNQLNSGTPTPSNNVYPSHPLACPKSPCTVLLPSQLPRSPQSPRSTEGQNRISKDTSPGILTPPSSNICPHQPPASLNLSQHPLLLPLQPSGNPPSPKRIDYQTSNTALQLDNEQLLKDLSRLREETDERKKKSAARERQLKARENSALVREANQDERDEQITLLKTHVNGMELRIKDLEEQNKLLKLKLLSSEDLRKERGYESNTQTPPPEHNSTVLKQMNDITTVLQATLLSLATFSLTNNNSSHRNAPTVTNYYHPPNNYHRYHRSQHNRYNQQRQREKRTDPYVFEYNHSPSPTKVNTRWWQHTDNQEYPAWKDNKNTVHILQAKDDGTTPTGEPQQTNVKTEMWVDLTMDNDEPAPTCHSVPFAPSTAPLIFPLPEHPDSIQENVTTHIVPSNSKRNNPTLPAPMAPQNADKNYMPAEKTPPTHHPTPSHNQVCHPLPFLEVAKPHKDPDRRRYKSLPSMPMA